MPGAKQSKQQGMQTQSKVRSCVARAQSAVLAALHVARWLAGRVFRIPSERGVATWPRQRSVRRPQESCRARSDMELGARASGILVTHTGQPVGLPALRAKFL